MKVTDLVQILVLPLNSCLALGKLLNLSELISSFVKVGIKLSEPAEHLHQRCALSIGLSHSPTPSLCSSQGRCTEGYSTFFKKLINFLFLAAFGSSLLCAGFL